ncbi:hypothetical protein [Cryobacterium ruanii]|uniref:Uncharacterized protein n=1 Tax=Cryobacterium ruanii TaxID=1259197 RepID=A0A4R9AKZ7_9MICO|nr:hypothetical protein [Cryobacterium ruanii]TFD64354.1 hypothetical protein E3T47_12875 [Cryobacterium ruanii]
MTRAGGTVPTGVQHPFFDGPTQQGGNNIKALNIVQPIMRMRPSPRSSKLRVSMLTRSVSISLPLLAGENQLGASICQEAV